MSKAGIAYLTIFGLFIGMIVTWNYTIRRPQINTAIAFLESLKQRNAKRGLATLCIGGGGYEQTPFPPSGTQSRFGVRVEEDDVFFGKRTQEYLICLQKEQGHWKVLQFVTLGDYADLAKLKQFKPTAPVH